MLVASTTLDPTTDEDKILRGGEMLNDPTVVVRRALLYNDAGLDVTSDNRTVLTCAEFWCGGSAPGLASVLKWFPNPF